MIEFDEAISASREYFDNDELAANVFVTKYALIDKDGTVHEKTPDDMHHRLAREFARVEKKYPNPLTEDEILPVIQGFQVHNSARVTYVWNR